MIVQIRLPDELYAKYAERDPKKPQQEIEKALLEAVELIPGEQRLILRGEELRKVKDLLEHPVSTVGELLEKLTKLKRVGVEGAGEVELTVGQLTRIKEMAPYMSQTPAEYLKDRVKAGLVAVVGP